MTSGKAPEQVTFLVESDFGVVLGHGDLNGHADQLLASRLASLAEHEIILRQLPTLAVGPGLTPENAQKLLDLSADPALDMLEAWAQCNQPK